MKALLLFLIVYNLHAIVLSHDNEKDSMFFKSYPKKVHQSAMLNAKLINSARYMKTVPPPVIKTKKPANNPGYTVFPIVSTIVPDSPYFPPDDFFHKHRERRILPRNKRSAPDPSRPGPVEVGKPTDDKPKDDKTKVINTKVNNPKTATAPKKEILIEGNKPAPKLTKVGKPVSKAGKKTKSRRGVLPKGKHNARPNKDGVTRKISRQGRKLKNGTNIKHPEKPGQKGKRQLRNGKLTKKNSGKVAKPGLPHKVVGGGRRLIAARDAPAEDYPYMISIEKDDEHWCSGALLNRRLIISTANCFWKSKSISRLKVRAGSQYPDQGGQVAFIQEVMKHPWWNIRSGPDNDLALALLDRTLKFSHTVHAVDLPNRAMMPPFDDFWVTSFGAERRDGVYERHGKRLQVYHTRLLDLDKCNNITQRFGVAVTENFICLTQYGRRSPCTRDTGAPAVSDGILWGLASWGIRKLCGTERYPSMFSYVASNGNMNFIINATSRLMSEPRDDTMLDRLPRNYYAQRSQTTSRP